MFKLQFDIFLFAMRLFIAEILPSISLTNDRTVKRRFTVALVKEIKFCMLKKKKREKLFDVQFRFEKVQKNNFNQNFKYLDHTNKIFKSSKSIINFLETWN